MAADADAFVISQRHCFERDLSTPCALVLLNTPLGGAAGARALRRAWRAAHWFRACADGAADRLLAAPGCARLAPDLICGDWDSISAAAEAHFAARGAALVKAPEDQDSTDLEKCLVQLERRAAADARLAARGGARAVRVVVFGAFGGRLDQEAQNLNALFAWRARFAQLTLLSADCLAALLPAGRSLVRVAAPFEGPTCGLVPLGAPVERLTTRGLRWDVADWRTAFGARISTSNRVDAARYPAAGENGDAEVEVEASAEIVWTASCRPADEDGDEEQEDEGTARVGTGSGAGEDTDARSGADAGAGAGAVAGSK